jgi:hypothetical protein
MYLIYAHKLLKAESCLLLEAERFKGREQRDSKCDRVSTHHFQRWSHGNLRRNLGGL